MFLFDLRLSVIIAIVPTPAIKHVHDVAEMSYKTKTGEKV